MRIGANGFAATGIGNAAVRTLLLLADELLLDEGNVGEEVSKLLHSLEVELSDTGRTEIVVTGKLEPVGCELILSESCASTGRTDVLNWRGPIQAGLDGLIDREPQGLGKKSFIAASASAEEKIPVTRASPQISGYQKSMRQRQTVVARR